MNEIINNIELIRDNMILIQRNYNHIQFADQVNQYEQNSIINFDNNFDDNQDDIEFYAGIVERVINHLRNNQIVPNYISCINVLHYVNNNNVDNEINNIQIEENVSEDELDNPVDNIVAAAEESTCTICLLDINVGDIVTLTPCNHMFHPGCFRPWYDSGHHTCPVCRHDFD
jgi:hypothetical protein